MAWGIMHPENNAYFISLDESQLKKIKEWEEIKTDLFVRSAENILNLKNLPLFRKSTLENMRKELIISLQDSGINDNLQIEWLNEEWNSVSLSESKKLKIQICKQLIDSILNKKDGHYECSNFGNTINFYVYDNVEEFWWIEFINRDLEAYRRLYNNPQT